MFWQHHIYFFRALFEYIDISKPTNCNSILFARKTHTVNETNKNVCWLNCWRYEIYKKKAPNYVYPFGFIELPSLRLTHTLSKMHFSKINSWFVLPPLRSVSYENCIQNLPISWIVWFFLIPWSTLFASALTDKWRRWHTLSGWCNYGSSFSTRCCANSLVSWKKAQIVPWNAECIQLNNSAQLFIPGRNHYVNFNSMSIPTNFHSFRFLGIHCWFVSNLNLESSSQQHISTQSKIFISNFVFVYHTFNRIEIRSLVCSLLNIAHW